MTEWLGAAEILNKAAKLIEERGWQQGSLVTVRSRCGATALESALFETGMSVVDFDHAHEAISRLLGIPREAPNEGKGKVPYWGRTLMEWNDAPGRTAAEVVAAFRDAAKLALDLANQQVRH